MTLTNTIRAIIVLAIVIAGGWYMLSRNTPTTEAAIVATVNGASITRAELTAAETQIAMQQGVEATSTEALASFQASALDLLIGQTLLKQAAIQAGIAASSTATEMELASAKAQFESEDAYQQALATRGMTEDDFRSKISDGAIIKAYLDQQVNFSGLTATDAEIQTLYDQLKSREPGIATPPLSQVRDQVAQLVVQQKQQSAADALVVQLRSAAQIEILIASSTPAV